MSNVQEWINNSRARANLAADHVANIATGVERWTMKVPPTDTDTDIMLIGLLDDTLGQALTAIQAVINVHTPVDARQQTCPECGTHWPCPTAQAVHDSLARVSSAV